MRIFTCVSTIFLLGISSANAQVPVDSIDVSGNGLVGVWKVEFPTFGAVSIFGGVTWGPLQANYCRIEETSKGLTANCFPYPGRDGNVTVKDGRFHAAWGSFALGMYVDGGMPSTKTLDGHFGIKLAGIATENANTSHGEKIDLSTTVSDNADEGLFLKQHLQTIVDGRDDGTVQAKGMLGRVPDANSLRPLGDIEEVIYLGNLPRPPLPGDKSAPNPNFYHVYDVEFSNGHRICGLHHRDDGVLDSFTCV